MSNGRFWLLETGCPSISPVIITIYLLYPIITSTLRDKMSKSLAGLVDKKKKERERKMRDSRSAYRIVISRQETTVVKSLVTRSFLRVNNFFGSRKENSLDDYMWITINKISFLFLSILKQNDSALVVYLLDLDCSSIRLISRPRLASCIPRVNERPENIGG